MTAGTIAVVGAGVAGLAAARALAVVGLTPVVLEATDRVGGKLRLGEVGGQVVDLGADAMLRRVPWGVELATGVGLDLVSPATEKPGLLTMVGGTIIL